MTPEPVCTIIFQFAQFATMSRRHRMGPGHKGEVKQKWGETNILYCTTQLNQRDMAIQAAWRAHLVITAAIQH